ncbi:Phage regulatory protein Rha [compost metagenome]
MENLVFAMDGEPMTDSLTVASVFKKEHDKILRDIRNLECSKEFSLANFGESEYVNERGRKYPKYTMTKDGFIFLVMGYTGKEAASFKERYIQEFNRMSEVLQNKHEALQIPPKMPEQQKQIESETFKYDLQRKWKWKPNSSFLSETLDFPTKKTLLRAIGDIGAIEHEQMVELYVVEQKHIHSMISRGEIVQHELVTEGQKYVVYTLGLSGSETIGQSPKRIENWTISDVIEKLVFFEFVRYLEDGAAPFKFKIKAAQSPFVGTIAYSNEECKVYVLQRPITSFEVPEDDGKIIYVLYPKEEHLKPLQGEFGWLELFPYSTFMPTEPSRHLNLLSSRSVILKAGSDPFEFLNNLL